MPRSITSTGRRYESRADRRALESCLNAGYSGEQCIEASDIMERLALDMGDFDILYGPEETVEDQAHPHWSAKVRHWAWQRWRG